MAVLSAVLAVIKTNICRLFSWAILRQWRLITTLSHQSWDAIMWASVSERSFLFYSIHKYITLLLLWLTASPPSNNTTQEMGYNNLQQLNRSAVGTRTLFAGGNSNNSGGAANTSHQAGPPTQGLFDSLRSEQMPGTPQRTHLGMLQASQLNSSNYSLNQSSHPPTTQLNDSYVANAPNAINASMRALCSPLGANMSPLTITHTPQARASDFWVTVFGFSPGASSTILQHFTMCGTIVDVVHAPQNGNWCTCALLRASKATRRWITT